MSEPIRIRDLASPDFHAIPVGETVEQAVDRIREAPERNVFYCYAIDGSGRLAGVVPVRKLLTASRGTRVADIMSDRVIALPESGDRALLQDFFATYRFLAFPVVDGERRLVGVVQADAFSDDLMGEFEGRVRHDWLLSLGLSEEERLASPFRIVRLRAPWLLFVVGSGIVSAFITGAFQDSVDRVVAIAFFVPVVLIFSESVGMQTSALVVSTLSEDVPVPLRRLFLREVAAALVLGSSAGVVVGAVALVWLGDLRFAAALAATLTLMVTTAAALAVTLPAIFRRAGVDPALAAAPLTLAATDNLTLLAYLTIASRLVAR